MEGSLLWALILTLILALILALISKQGCLGIGRRGVPRKLVVWSLETREIKVECRKLC